MLRAILYILVLTALSAGAVWIAGQPGHVSLEWLGWRVEPPVWALLLGILALAAVISAVFGVLRLILRLPREFRRARAERRRQQGYRALTQGMVAVAAGDAAEAKRHARRAHELLREPPLTMLLAAQAAQLDGDEDAARRYFTAMLERPETALLGTRGLLMQALRAGDDQAALALADRARRERPDAPWAVGTLLEVQLRNAMWPAAEASLREAVRLKTIDAAKARRWRALILAERAREAAAPRTGAAIDAALGHLEEAVRLAPDLVAARARLAALTALNGRLKAAQRMIEHAWAQEPHPELAAAWAGLVPDETPLARARRFERLAAQNPQHRESHLALAEAALAAGLWGEARLHLDKAIALRSTALARSPTLAQGGRVGEGAGPVAGGQGAERAPASPLSARICRLMARLEEAEHAGHARVRRWLIAAAEGEPDPAWVCDKCGTPAAEWRAVCGHCRGFDTLVWRVPPRPPGPALLLPIGPAGDSEGRAPGSAVAEPESGPASPAARRKDDDAGESVARPAAAGSSSGAQRALPTPPRLAAEEGGPPVDAARLVN